MGGHVKDEEAEYIELVSGVRVRNLHEESLCRDGNTSGAARMHRQLRCCGSGIPFERRESKAFGCTSALKPPSTPTISMTKIILGILTQLVNDLTFANVPFRSRYNFISPSTCDSNCTHSCTNTQTATKWHKQTFEVNFPKFRFRKSRSVCPRFGKNGHCIAIRLYMTTLPNPTVLMRNFGGNELLDGWFDRSSAAKTKCNERFARWYRYERPPEMCPDFAVLKQSS